MIRTTNIRDGRIDLSTCRYVERDTYERWTRRAKVKNGDILLTREAPIGEIGFVQGLGDVFLGQRIMQYRADRTKVLPRFLYYSFRSPDLQHQFGTHEGSGSVVSHIRVADCHDFEVNIPPLAEQAGIANLLGDIDDKIELNRRTNETLQAMAQAIFRDWFVDFGPVHRKMQGETDPVAILGGLIEDADKAAQLAALFPDTLGASGLPEGWSEEPIGDICDTVGGATPPTKSAEYWENGKHFWATPKDLSNLSGLYVRTTERSISDEGLARISSGLSPKGSILMSSRAPIGYVAIASVPVAVNQGFIVMRPTERMPTEYAYFWTKANMDLIESNANGSTFQEISKKNFRPLPVIMPDAQTMLAFVNLAKPMLGRIEQGEIENQTLAETRDYLLPKLMSGQIQAGGIAEKAAMDGTMNDNVMSLFPDLDTQESEQKLQDAVLVACVVHALQTDDLVVGNVRYQKGVYFLRRLTGAVMPTTTKMAAGPYDAHLAHHGGFQEALGLGYIKRRKNGQFEGTVPGHAIATARKFAREAGLSDAINWVAENLRGKSREELEVLATVDFAMRELVASGKLITAQTIREDIKSDSAWRPKLGKRHFMGNAIPSAIAELRQWFPNDYNTT